MKKLTSTLALASLILLASCNKDKQSSTTTTTPKTGIDLLTDGSWEAQSMRHVVKVNGYVMHDTTEAIIGTISFLKNNTVIANIPGEGVDTSAYAFHGDSLTIDDMNYDIITFTSKSLVIENEETETDSASTGSFSFITTLSLKK